MGENPTTPNSSKQSLNKIQSQSTTMGWNPIVPSPSKQILRVEQQNVFIRIAILDELEMLDLFCHNFILAQYAQTYHLDVSQLFETFLLVAKLRLYFLLGSCSNFFSSRQISKRNYKNMQLYLTRVTLALAVLMEPIYFFPFNFCKFAGRMFDFS